MEFVFDPVVVGADDDLAVIVDVDAVVITGGVGYSAESTPRFADIYSFSDNEGLFLGDKSLILSPLLYNVLLSTL